MPTSGKRELKNKPLVEAILELKWALQKSENEIESDPSFKIALGQLYHNVREEYPYHEELPAAKIPDGLIGHIVQHRFRCAKGNWPLIQIGPGVFSVNETSGYTWNSFEPRCIEAVKSLLDVYPADQPAFESLMLRYINAVEFHYESENILTFLRERLKLGASLPERLFDEKIEGNPTAVSAHTSFRCHEPKGTATLKVATGTRNKSPALLWEILVHSGPNDVPDMPQGLEKWLRGAHALAHNWFFALIEGELEENFA